MKKFLFLLLFAIPLMGYAQKSYVFIQAVSSNSNGAFSTYLSGDLPADVDTYYSATIRYDGEFMTVGRLLNILSAEGFEVEQMTSALKSSTGEYHTISIIMSKAATNVSSKIQTIRGDGDNGDAYEVARYNLQGMPVKETEKGIQIIVFSNYTTKTVIVE
ncbi:MAG: hypothetical protein K5893_05750 [Prevotella sp.]|nr:hypothetical protein [Prevotella sp.]